MGGGEKLLKHLTMREIQEIQALADARDRAEPRSGVPITMGTPEADALVEKILDDKSGREGVALFNRLESLSAEAIAELAALVWIGRGDGGAAAQFQKHVESALEDGRVQALPGYLAAKAPLRHYIANGLRMLGL